MSDVPIQADYKGEVLAKRRQECGLDGWDLAKHCMQRRNYFSPKRCTSGRLINARI